jgi:hypothetical protein
LPNLSPWDRRSRVRDAASCVPPPHSKPCTARTRHRILPVTAVGDYVQATSDCYLCAALPVRFWSRPRRLRVCLAQVNSPQSPPTKGLETSTSRRRIVAALRPTRTSRDAQGQEAASAKVQPLKLLHSTLASLVGLAFLSRQLPEQSAITSIPVSMAPSIKMELKRILAILANPAHRTCHRGAEILPYQGRKNRVPIRAGEMSLVFHQPRVATAEP